MRFVPIKRVEQQDLQALHRIRGLLSEYGIVLPQSIGKFRALTVEKLENDGEQLPSQRDRTYDCICDVGGAGA